MKASVLDLRNRMSRILAALDRNESVTITYHGREKAILSPIRNKKELKVRDHVFFGMNSDSKKSVADEMDNLRGGRFNDL